MQRPISRCDIEGAAAPHPETPSTMLSSRQPAPTPLTTRQATTTCFKSRANGVVQSGESPLGLLCPEPIEATYGDSIGAAGFCTDGEGKTKCKKTCDLCR